MVEVCCATSFDERFDPQNVLTADTKQFWVSTGLYPQELVFQFSQPKQVNEVKFTMTGARKVVVEACQGTTGNAFQVVGESRGKC